ncbi:mediator of DNA damage checkpoint protein 1 [Hoplias malabaricus]|uniref:mediator of DNA damage checkpoint protein 1 n=1 Tax=Hoplias malabaricus TaxID=27720 RepID=UPI003463849E
MDATQQIDDSFYEEEDDTEEEKEQGEGKNEREPLAALKVLKNNYIPETEVPLYQGENVVGRDPASCSVPLQTRSISGRHAVIFISTFRRNDRHHDERETLLWDLGSLNGTRKGRIKLTPHVRYAVTEGDSIVLADLPCQYISLKKPGRNTHTAKNNEKAKDLTPTSRALEEEKGRGVENGAKRSVLPPVPLWGDKDTSSHSPQTTPKQPERTLVPESDSDSDGEKDGQRDRRRLLASDSSDLSSPTCSTFLTPANKVIPESEDESSITPSSSAMSRLKTDSPRETSSDSIKPAVLNFNMDSDTDVEEEEEEEEKVVKYGPKLQDKAASPSQVKPIDPACIQMDSDTDAEDEGLEKRKSPEISSEVTHKDLVTPAGGNMDSDTDVEDEKVEIIKRKSPDISAVAAQKDTEASAGRTMGSLSKVEEKETSETKSGLDQKAPTEFHMDSDTDVEDEDVPVTTNLKTPVSAPLANPVGEFHMDSDTDAEEEKPAIGLALISDSETEDDDPFKPTKGKSLENQQTPQVKTMKPDSDSDTDMEEDIRATSSKPHKDTETSLDPHCGSPAPVQLPAEKVQDEFRMDSDTDVEEEEEKFVEGEQKASEAAAGVKQSSASRGTGLSEEEMETQAFDSAFKRPALPSLLQSTVSPGGRSLDSEDFTVAETQSFVSDADAKLDDTQQSLRGCGASAFRLSLSDSSHQQPEPEEQAEASDPAEEDWTLQPTQSYAMKTPGVRGAGGAGEKCLDLEATQAYAAEVDQDEDEKETQPLAEGNDHIDTNRVSITGKSGRRAAEDEGEMVDSHPSTADTLILVRSQLLEEPTQPYALFTAQTLPLGDDDDDEEEDFSARSGPSETHCKDRRQTDEEQTQPMEPSAGFHMAIAETLPMLEEDEECEVEKPGEMTSSKGLQGGRKAARIEETQPLESDVSTHPAIAETQPMAEDEEGQGQEQQNKTVTSRRSHRGQKDSKAEVSKSFKSVSRNRGATAHTEPLNEGEEEQDEEEQRETMTSRRSRRGRKPSKVEETKPLESDASSRGAIAETEPVKEDEENESETTAGKKPQRARKAKEAQPNEPHVGAQKATGEDEAQEGEQQGGRQRRHRGSKTARAEPTQPRESDTNTDTRDKTLGEEEDEEQEASRRGLRGKRKGVRGRVTAEKEVKSNTAKEEDSEEEADVGRTRRGRKSMRPKSTEKERLEEKDEEIEEREPSTREEEARQKLEHERKEREEKEREAKERLEKEKSEREEKEKLEKEKRETEEKHKREREERERLEREEKEEREKEEKERLEKERQEKERMEKEKREKEEKERLEKEKKERQEKERMEKEKREKEEKERLEKEKKERQEKERMEKEKREKEEKERLEKKKKERQEKERMEKEKREKEEKERFEKEKKERQEKERMEKEKREKEEKERLEKERQEKERMEKEKREKEEKERLEKEKKERQEKERLVKEKREREVKEKREREEKERLEAEKREKEEKERLEKQKKQQEKLEQKRAKERKEQEEKDRLESERQTRDEKGQTKKDKEKVEMEQKEKRKRTKEETEGVDKDTRPKGKRRAGLVKKEEKGDEELEDGNVKIENCREVSGGAEQEEDKTGKVGKEVQEKVETETKPGRGRRLTRKSTAPLAGTEDLMSLDVPAKRTRSRSNSSNSVCSEQSTSTLDEQSKVRGRGKGKNPAEEVISNSRPSGRRKTATAPSTVMELESGAHIRSRSNSKSSERSGSSAEAQNKGNGGRGRKSVKVEKPEEAPQEVVAAGSGRRRGGKRQESGDVKVEVTEKGSQEEKSDVSSVNEDNVISQTPNRGRKRGGEATVLAVEAQPTSKTPRRSLATQGHKVLFTGVVDEDGEKVLLRLGGGLAKGVSDMTHLVTDKVRRTVKFLCAVARGVPIVTQDWLIKCGKAGTFLSPNEFFVKDAEQEKKFNFKLQDSLRAASRQPLLQGYEIHVTPSVKPEPSQMKDIIACCGARFLPKMPSAQKGQMVVVVSCEEDQAQCNKALRLSIPVVSAEFLLTGILQQKVDLQTHALSPSPSTASKGHRK